GGKNSLNRLIRCVCGKKIGPDPRNFNQRVSLGRNDLLIRTFLIKHMARRTLKLFVKNETPPKVTHEDLVKNRPRSPVRPPIPATAKTPDLPERH
ncbi:putative protein YneK, partial [Escherichia coli]|uniref:putative protein YneK n=1 Tax=Escherichia coli TaxID=562 RepID=UPI00201FFBE8